MPGKLVRTMVKIPSGSSLSGELDISDYDIVAIQGPAAWTAATLTFQCRATTGADADGTTTPPTAVPGPVPGEVVDDSGVAIGVTMAAATYVTLTGAEKEALGALRFVKIRSGTLATPVVQAADRYLWLVLSPFNG